MKGVDCMGMKGPKWSCDVAGAARNPGVETQGGSTFQ